MSLKDFGRREAVNTGINWHLLRRSIDTFWTINYDGIPLVACGTRNKDSKIRRNVGTLNLIYLLNIQMKQTVS